MRDRSRNDGPDILEFDNEFWRFSLAIYGQAHVAEECLSLQQTLGIDVNLLLFCAWLGTRAVTLGANDIEDASTAVDNWHQNVVRPLRGARQWVKTFNREELGGLRGRMKEIELDAEQVEQAILFAYSKHLRKTAGADRGDAIASNVSRYLKAKSAGQTSAASAPHLIEVARRAL
jgi:uncharacterized protein (TIGR02444 family)